MVFHRVLAHAKSNPRLFESFYDTVIEPRRELFRVVLRRGIERGEIRADADLELLITLIIGSSVLHEPGARERSRPGARRGLDRARRRGPAPASCRPLALLGHASRASGS